MKSMIWKIDGPERWEWDKTGMIHVYDISDISNNDIEKVIEIIVEVINEFGLPLLVQRGDMDKTDDLVQFLEQCSDNYEIDFNYLEEELNRNRRKAEFLPFGVVIIVDDTFSFKQPNHESAVYGSATHEGLIVIKRKYIDKAMKHEFGHMIGIGEHHPNCVMYELCNHNKFCKQCQKDIKKIWEL